MDIQDQVAQAMEQLDRNIERAQRNPEAVLNGNFEGKSRSGSVTVWVDAMGRVEAVRIAPGFFTEGEEKRLTDELMSANKAAQRAAETLDFGEEREPKDPAKCRAPSNWEEEEEDFGGPGSFLR